MAHLVSKYNVSETSLNTFPMSILELISVPFSPIADPSTTSRTGGAVLKTPPTGSVDIHLPVTSSPGHVNVTKILEEPGENPSGRGRGRGDRGRGRGGKKKGKKKGKKGGKKKKDPPPREPTGDGE